MCIRGWSLRWCKAAALALLDGVFPVYMHVCMYACMHVCMNVCMHVCMHGMNACMHAWHVCMYAFVCVYVCVCVCAYIYASVHVCACVLCACLRKKAKEWSRAWMVWVARNSRSRPPPTHIVVLVVKHHGYACKHAWCIQRHNNFTGAHEHQRSYGLLSFQSRECRQANLLGWKMASLSCLSLWETCCWLLYEGSS